MGDENPIRTLGDYSKPSHEGYKNTVELLVGNNVDLALYDDESWNEPRNFAKPVKEIALPQDVPMVPMTLNIAWKTPNKPLLTMHPRVLMKREAITDQIAGTLPSDTVKNPKLNTSPVLCTCSYLTIVPQCSSHPSTSINAIKAHSEEANISQISLSHTGTGMLGKHGSTFIQGEVLAKMEDPRLFTLPCRLGDSKPFDTLADLGSCVNIIPLYLFKKLNIGLLEESDHIFGLADGTKSYPVGIVKDVEVHIGKLKLLNDFYVIDMKKDPETPLLVGRGFLTTANAVIDCWKAKIAVGEGITRSVFGVKGVDLGEEEAPY
ncbi:MAK10-like protein [Tanacetum coccineum]